MNIRSECVVCMDDLPSRKTAKLKCGHRMCHSCLKRSFKLSITDPQHMPPRCCTSDNIPLKHVNKLFDNDFKKTWNKKFVEYSAKNRIYCVKPGCNEFIRPEDIHHTENGRKYGRCVRCRTKVCVKCNGKWHGARDCPKDEETVRFLAQAKAEGWQRCFRCKAMVELKEGCNHMTWCVTPCPVCRTKLLTCEQSLRSGVLHDLRFEMENLRMSLVQSRCRRERPASAHASPHTGPRSFWRSPYRRSSPISTKGLDSPRRIAICRTPSSPEGLR